jgi:asparagine synthase (glutamine-hydrolysing)
VSRWLAGIFDPHTHIDGTRLPGALAPHAATILELGPLGLAHTGPPALSTNPLCLLDGHLDNAAEIHRELSAADHQAPIHARTLPSGTEHAQAWSSPEELLAAGYRRWGRALLPRLRGDFALLIWDRELHEGLIARDQLGVRPFFLHDNGGCLRFAGEVCHLLALLPRRPAPDPASMAHWLAVSNRPGPETLYAGVRRLQPGGVLLLDRRGAREERYWAPRFEEPFELHHAQLAVRGSLELAVRRRISADGLTGVLMSGGLDSSSVAALGAEQASDRMYACSATFPEHPAADESELIEQLRATLALPGLSAAVRPGGLLASALESLAAWQMPLRSWGDFWALPLLRAAAHAGVEVMLGGDGGDELFGPRSYLLADRLRTGHPWDALALALALPGAGDRPPRRQVARVFGSLALLGALPPRLHGALSAVGEIRDAPRWLLPWAMHELVETDDPMAWKRLDGPRWWAHAAHGITLGIEQAGVFEHHRRRAALAGVESRHPLLDLDLVEVGLRQPPRATFDPHRSRPLLRASMAGLLPDAVRLRPGKALFESLIVDCLRGPDQPIVRRLLTDPGAELGAYVDPRAIQQVLFDTDTELHNSPFRWMWQVWRLLTAELWLRAQEHSLERLHACGLHASPARIEIERTGALVRFSTLTPSGGPLSCLP